MCFQSNQFINIRFADNDVVKMGAGGETYGDTDKAGLLFIRTMAIMVTVS